MYFVGNTRIVYELSLCGFEWKRGVGTEWLVVLCLLR